MLGSEFAQCLCDSAVVETSSCSEYLLMNLSIFLNVFRNNTAVKTKEFEFLVSDTVSLASQVQLKDCWLPGGAVALRLSVAQGGTGLGAASAERRHVCPGRAVGNLLVGQPPSSVPARRRGLWVLQTHDCSVSLITSFLSASSSSGITPA